MNVALIGYRGTGKSTVARLLAEHWKLPSFDADDEVEGRAGKSIQQIFADDGEKRFRDIESEVVAALAEKDNAVVALGGGAVLREGNRAELRQCKIVWLQAAAETIESRIGSDPTTQLRRPNLTARGGLAEIHELLAKREPIYRQCADYAVQTDGKTPEQLRDEIVCLLQECMS